MKKIKTLSQLRLRGMGRLTCAAAALALSGCATITQGSKQSVYFNTAPTGAKCSIERTGDGILYPEFITPQSLEVSKDKDELIIKCRKPGYEDAFIRTDSTFQSWTLGNLLIGGIFGLGLDFASGAANQYPGQVVIPLKPLSGTEPAAAEQQPAAPAPQAPAPKEKSRVIVCAEGQTCIVE